MLSLCGFHPLYEKKHFFFLSGCVFKFCLGWFSNAMGLTVILCHFSSCNHLLLWPFFFSRWKKYEFRQWILAYSTSLHEGCAVVSWGNTESALLAKCRICLLLKCRICLLLKCRICLHCVLLFNARQAGFFFSCLQSDQWPYHTCCSRHLTKMFQCSVHRLLDLSLLCCALKKRFLW